MILKIGTRGSKLAIAQSLWVKKRIETRHTDIQVELVTIKTKGDKILDSPLSQVGGKGLFVKEIEEALLTKQVDLAVHSMKDVQAELPEELILCSFPEREDPSDVLVSTKDKSIDTLSPRSKVGTSSLRRSAQLLHMRPDLELVPLRGNVDTRLRKLEWGEVDAIVLAAAGLKRLGLEELISHIIPFEQIMPAIGQGALGLEVRRYDERTIDLLDFLNHEPTEVAVRAERSFLKELEGGCQVPIAGLARLDGDAVHLKGMVAELDGSRIVSDEITGKKGQAEEIGIRLAGRLLAAGADGILASVYGRK
jgi:hydroxymethylbilane synthase